ncbi:formate-dependent phosphoribosylglycinamide formyltransferase [Candidatus Methylocalor cossyra]|uniref:Formate-dependent phosphoribosylglycinamide formyltransferase n=1 Tax=Candidatus Methylocalor cossyra TaxID=3108543 RepID=A0ABP1C5M0_9GAMM
MKIGTAGMPGATRVMLLGSGELGKEIAIALQRFGVEVIAVDRYAHAPAQQVAHRAHVIDMTDGAAVKRLVEMDQPRFIVPELEAIATDVLTEIHKPGHLEVVPSPRAVQLTMNREGIRRLAAEQLGLPTSRYAFADSPEGLHQAAEHVGYPCFVKPVMSSSGKGQSLASGPADLPPAWERAQAGGRVPGARVIVEGRIEFDYEITLLTVRALNPQGDIETHFCEPIGHRQEQGDYVESWQPQPMSPAALAEARRIAKTVTDALGGRGVFGVELFVRGDRVWFSEVSPRPHDTGMVTMVTQAQSEFDLHVRALLGLPVATTLRATGASAVIYGGLEGEGIAFEGLELALQVPASEIRLFGKPVAHPRRRMGVALATGASLAEARERARRAAERVRPVPA